MDHVFGSKRLVNELSLFGFSISYDEVTRYKQSVIQNENLDDILLKYLPGTFTQWVADNVDHNVITLDGQDTFHDMGVIAISSSDSNDLPRTYSKVVRRQQCVKVTNLVQGKGTEITSYFSSKKSLASIKFKLFLQLKFLYTMPLQIYSDLLWHSGWMFSSAEHPRPNWSGFMQHVFSSNHNISSKSEVLFLPIIDLSPSYNTCIYSTLNYAQNQAKKLNIQSPC